MGLSLGVKEGAQITFNGADKLTVLWISAKAVRVEIERRGHPENEPGDKFDIVATERKEILPAVFCQLGKPVDHGSQSYARLVFEAPRSVQIDRVKEHEES